MTTATLAKLAARGDIAPDERVVLVITGEGLKTLDAVRDTFDAHEIDAVVRPVRRAGRGRGARLMAVTVKLPTQLRAAAGGAGDRRRCRARRSARCSTRCSTEHGELRDRLMQDGDLRRFVNVYVDGEDVRTLDGLDTPVREGGQLTILPAVAGG